MAAPTEMVTWICEPSTGTVDRATTALHLSHVSARMSFVMAGRITKNSSPPNVLARRTHANNRTASLQQ